MSGLKTDLYKNLLERQIKAHQAGYYFEACWLSYAMFEDRMNSISRNSAPFSTYKNLHEKIEKIRNRLKLTPPPKNLVRLEDSLLEKIDIWRELRNGLMHDLADGTKSMAECDAAIKHLSEEALSYTKQLSKAARWIKKHNK